MKLIKQSGVVGKGGGQSVSRVAREPTTRHVPVYEGPALCWYEPNKESVAKDHSGWTKVIDIKGTTFL
jgi:hypothetical protein